MVTGFWIASPAAAEPLRVRFLTYNINFNSTAAEVQYDLDLLAPRADVMMFQEAKERTIDNFLDESWQVFQVLGEGPGKKGSAIAVRNSIKSQVLDWGLRFGVDNHGEQMHDRWILWADIRFINNRVVRIMSLHFPPGRFEYLQPIMADNFANFVAATPHPIVAGGDWNFLVNNDKWNIRQKSGLRPEGVGIDGFYFTAATAQFASINKYTGLDTHSDHKAVRMLSDVEPPVVSAVGDWAIY